ncbi:MAG: hypothetical protein VW907_02495, partial [Opitutae bacterium]
LWYLGHWFHSGFLWVQVCGVIGRTGRITPVPSWALLGITGDFHCSRFVPACGAGLNPDVWIIDLGNG